VSAATSATPHSLTSHPHTSSAAVSRDSTATNSRCPQKHASNGHHICVHSHQHSSVADKRTSNCHVSFRSSHRWCIRQLPNQVPCQKRLATATAQKRCEHHQVVAPAPATRVCSRFTTCAMCMDHLVLYHSLMASARWQRLNRTMTHP
jgi:hypothetical protein